MFGYTPPKPEPEKPAVHYSLDVSEVERDLLLALLRDGKAKTGTQGRRAEIARRLGIARKHDGKPLPDAALDWARLEMTAKVQGISVADAFWDEARGKEPG